MYIQQLQSSKPFPMRFTKANRVEPNSGYSDTVGTQPRQKTLILFSAAEARRLNRCRAWVVKHSKACRTQLLADLNSKVWFRRCAPAVLLSNLIPEFSSARQKHDVWTGPEANAESLFKCKLHFSLFNDIPPQSLHCKLVSVQYQECEYNLFMCLPARATLFSSL